MRVIIFGFTVDIQGDSRSSCHMDRLARRSRSPVELTRSSAVRSPILNHPCSQIVRSRQLRSPDGLPPDSQQANRSRGRPSNRSRSRSTSRLHIRQPSRRRTRLSSESRSRHLHQPRVPSNRQGRSPSRRLERLRSRERSRSRSTPRSRESRRRSVRTQNYPSRRHGRTLDDGETTQFANSGLQLLLDALKYAGRTDNNLDKLVNMNNTIPEFDPSRKEQTMTMWLHKVNECSTIYGWTEKQTVHFALPKLRGIAQRWYEGLPSVLFSWDEWQTKLLSAFPSTENYGQMLSDMLAKRARFGDSLETYYYDKIALLNRCGITGSRAVECILHGIDDRSIRLGAEAVQYDNPDKLLAYLRNARNSRMNERKIPRSQFVNRSQEPSLKQMNKSTRCFNCKQEGHTVPQCPQPVKKCSKCQRIGHDAEHCYSKGPLTSDKNVLRVINDKQLGEKYLKTVEVNGIPYKAFLDFGSDCCMIRISDFIKSHNQYKTDDLPTLKGFGNSIVNVLGKQLATIKIDEVEADVELFVVPDEAMHVPVMIGQTFTEQPHIVVHKTSDKLELLQAFNHFSKHCKVKLFCKCETLVSGTSVISIYTEPLVTGDVYIEGGIRLIKDTVFSVLPGLFSINDNGEGELLISIASGKKITINKDYLIARGYMAEEYKDTVDPKVMAVNTVSQGLYQPIKMDEVKTGPNISSEEKDKLLLLLNNFRECFAASLAELGKATVGEMSITLHDEEPVVYRPYRLSIKEKEVVREMVTELLDNGIIQPSTSSYASPVVLVRKKTGDYRLCIDYRALNKKTVRENYPMPLIDDQLDLLAGNEFYTTLDLASGYYQIPIRESDKHKTGFVTPEGHFEFNRMPFGLANAPSTFQRIMNQVLGSTRHKEALAYLDDVIIPAKNFQEGIKRLEKVLSLFSSAGLTLKLSKCIFFGNNVDYLGFQVSKRGIQPGSSKVEAVAKFPVPQNQHNVRQFLGLASFFRRFVPGFSIIAKPLTRLLGKDTSWNWGEEQQSAFKELQNKLTQKPTLALYDPNAETELHTDACKVGVAGILIQLNKDRVRLPVAYFSRQTSPEEQKYSSYDLETLAVVASLRKFRVYLIGITFKIVTDCNSLRATFQKRDMIPRVARWWEQMQEYTFNIEYRAGVSMAHVDALSRNPVPNSCPIASRMVRRVTEESWLATVQSADSEIQRKVQILKDPNLDDIIDIKTNFKLRGEKLFRITPDGDRWVVPKGVRWQILKINHDDIGHFSMDKTLEKVKSVYWFPKMRSFIKKYVASCLECSYAKATGGKKPGYLHPIEKIDIPFDTIHVDHVGPFVRSSRGNMHILVIIDAYTKYIYLKPVRNTKSNTTIRVLKEYFGIFGVPRRVISDRGTSFSSTLFKKFVNAKNVKHVMNAVATPRANGQVERYNKVIVDALTAKSVGTSENKWDDHLPDIQWGLNNTFNKGINRTPAEALFGVRPTGSTESKIIHDLDKNRATIRDEINTHIKACQQNQKESFDKHRCSPPEYNVGDLVRVERQVPATGQSKKLVPKFQGPYRIAAILDHDRFAIEDTPLTSKRGRSFSTIVAVDKIKPWLNFNRPHVSGTYSSESDNEEPCK